MYLSRPTWRLNYHPIHPDSYIPTPLQSKSRIRICLESRLVRIQPIHATMQKCCIVQIERPVYPTFPLRKLYNWVLPAQWQQLRIYHDTCDLYGQILYRSIDLPTKTKNLFFGFWLVFGVCIFSVFLFLVVLPPSSRPLLTPQTRHQTQSPLCQRRRSLQQRPSLQVCPQETRSHCWRRQKYGLCSDRAVCPH